LIGFWGLGFYSHIDVLTPTGMLRGARSDWIKGIPPGYMDRPYDYERWEAQTQFTLEVSEDQYDKYWRYSDKQLYKPYDFRGLIKTFVFGRNWRDDDSWWCSEEVAMNGEVAGIWTLPEHVKNVEPGHCAFLLAGKSAVIKEILCR
jgi:hypothetical protein